MQTRLAAMFALVLGLALGLGGCAGLPGPPLPQESQTLPGQPVWQQRHPGLQYALYAPLPGSRVHALRVDLAQPGLKLALSLPVQRGQVLPEMTGLGRVVAAVNASFFDLALTPRGLTVSQGQAWQPVLAAQQSPLLACDAGMRCTMRLHPPYQLHAEWQLVVAGTPWLVEQGQARSAAMDANCPRLCAVRHPRSAVGLDASTRTLFIVVAEGRQADVPGLTLAELATLLQDLGAEQALNLDGGGSSALMVDGELVSRRPANEPALRRLANALLILAAE